jgi:hypothetical protein
MQQPDREYIEALDQLFNEFALEDQRRYYQACITKNRQAANQVGKLRAICSLLAGLAAAIAGFIVQSSMADGQCASVTGSAVASAASCGGLELLVGVLLFVAIVAPVFGGALGTLADLFQWDKLATIYIAARESIEVADARSPIPEMDDLTYLASLRASAEGALAVMRDETAQWGQLVRTPEQLDKFIEAEKVKAAQAVAIAPGNVAPTATPAAPGQPAQPADSTSALDDSHSAG